MADYVLDREGLIFVSFALAVSCWAVFDTERYLRLLSLNRQTTFTRFQLMVIRVPGAICALGVAWWILVTLIYKR